jgi:acetyl esterase/lipase
MTTTKARFFNFMLRNRHVFSGKLRKEVFDMDTSIEGFRDQCERGAARFGKLPKEVKSDPLDIEGIKSEFLIPDGTDRSKLILYVHGGGYVSGSCKDHRGVVSKLAKNTRFQCLQYEYRLAPEHPFPAAVDDSVLVYRWLLKNGFHPENILVAGESAGGGLALALLLAIKKYALPMLAAAVAISPWTDLTCSGESYQTKNKRSLAPLHSWTVFSNHYVGNNDPKNPLISPLFGDLSGLPPLFINSGEDDELFDDGRLFAEKAKQTGVDVTFTAGKDMVHCYPLMAPMFREATEAMDEIITFIVKHLQE